jgi:hypothetical protein
MPAFNAAHDRKDRPSNVVEPYSVSAATRLARRRRRRRRRRRKKE